MAEPGYRVELYPHLGQPTGIKDEFGNDQQFPAAFIMALRWSVLSACLRLWGLMRR